MYRFTCARLVIRFFAAISVFCGMTPGLPLQSSNPRPPRLRQNVISGGGGRGSRDRRRSSEACLGAIARRARRFFGGKERSSVCAPISLLALLKSLLPYLVVHEQYYFQQYCNSIPGRSNETAHSQE